MSNFGATRFVTQR